MSEFLSILNGVAVAAGALAVVVAGYWVVFKLYDKLP